MGKIIAIANQKGGVGKTTTATNLGIGLAQLGKKVLCIDADSQGNLSVSLGIDEPDRLDYTLADIIADTVNENPTGRNGIHHHEEGIDFIPSNIDLSNTEVQLISTIGRETILKQYVDGICSDYDYIIIDCSPNLGMLTINALTCADSVIIPVQASYLPLKGLQQLIRTINKIKRQLNPKLTIGGILVTMVDNRTNYAKDIIQLLNNEYGNAIKIFNSLIPRSVKQEETAVSGNSIYKYAKSCKTAKSYEAFVAEVVGEV
jgi:chromosome partitioning protein